MTVIYKHHTFLCNVLTTAVVLQRKEQFIIVAVQGGAGFNSFTPLVVNECIKRFSM